MHSMCVPGALLLWQIFYRTDRLHREGMLFEACKVYQAQLPDKSGLDEHCIVTGHIGMIKLGCLLGSGTELSQGLLKLG